MEVKRILLTLLLLSLVNIGFLILLLYKSSNWSGTYHTLITFTIKKLQYLDNSLATTTEPILDEKPLELTTKNDTAASNPNSSPEQKQELDSSKKTKLEKPNHYVRASKLTPLNRYRRPSQTWLKTSHSSNKKPAPKTQQSGDSSGPVTVWVDDNSSRIFTISKNFTFPHFKCILKDIKKIVGTPWVKELAQIMARSNEQTIFAITVNAGYKESLLNWLISAVFKGDLSLNRILVISLDKNTQVFLQRHGITCIYVPTKSLFDSAKSHYRIDNYGLVMFSRISVIRLLNHWGFSVVIIDTDAIVLQDPQPLFDKYPASSIVASRGTQPLTLYAIWNVTICNGLILLRSTQEIGMFLALYILVYLCIMLWGPLGNKNSKFY